MALREAPAMRRLMNELLAAIPGSQDGGIVANKPGYHNSRENLPSSDYSVQFALDRQGRSDFSAAFDLTMRNMNTMITVSKRLVNAFIANDPRLRCVRGFNCTIDGRNARRWDIAHGNRTTTIWTDDTHLWHIHCEIFRAYVDDWALMAGVRDVLTGAAGVAAAATSEEEKEMHLVTVQGNSTIYLSDGLTARAIKSEKELADVIYRARKQGLYTLREPSEGYIVVQGVRVAVVGYTDLVGKVVA